jgi:chromate transporter
MNDTIWQLLGFFGMLSLVSVGGGNAVMPEIQRFSVLAQQWLTASDFTAVYAIAQAAPGPSSMIVALIGYKAAGWGGAAAAAVAMYTPSSLIILAAVRFLESFKQSTWAPIFERAVAPLGVGLIFSSAYIVGSSMETGPAMVSLIIGSAVIHWKLGWNPLLLLAAGAIIGALGWI